MTERSQLDATERTALRGRPPRDEAGKRIPWRLADRVVTDQVWEDESFEIEELTLERVTFERLAWTAQSVFRRCVLREVSFAECELSGLRFEDVVFERCDIAGLQVARCAFVRCRFAGGTFGGVQALHSKLEQCAWVGVEASRWSLDDCELLGCTLEDTRLTELRASKCTLGLSIVRGALVSADLSVCKGTALEMDGATVKGVRARGLDLDRFSLWAAPGGQVSLSECTLGEVSLSGCDRRTAFTLLASKVGALKIEACPSLQNLLVRDTELRAVHVADSSLWDTTFDGVTAPGGSVVESSSLRGLFFKGGVWTKLHLADVELWSYVAVDGTRFESLTLERIREPEPVARRLKGDQYGPGSHTWRASDGS